MRLELGLMVVEVVRGLVRVLVRIVLRGRVRVVVVPLLELVQQLVLLVQV